MNLAALFGFHPVVVHKDASSNVHRYNRSNEATIADTAIRSNASNFDALVSKVRSAVKDADGFAKIHFANHDLTLKLEEPTLKDIGLHLIRSPYTYAAVAALSTLYARVYHPQSFRDLAHSGVDTVFGY